MISSTLQSPSPLVTGWHITPQRHTLPYRRLLQHHQVPVIPNIPLCSRKSYKALPGLTYAVNSGQSFVAPTEKVLREMIFPSPFQHRNQQTHLSSPLNLLHLAGCCGEQLWYREAQQTYLTNRPWQMAQGCAPFFKCSSF